MTYPNASKTTYVSSHDAPIIVIVPLTILSLLAIFFGYVARDLFVGIGSDFLSPSLFIHPMHISLVEAEFSISLFNKLLPAILTLLGAFSAIYMYHIIPQFIIGMTNTTFGRTLYKFYNGKYYVDVIYNHYIINNALGAGYTISKVLDRGLIELVGPYGLAVFLSTSSQDMSKLDTGNLTSYALYITLGLVGLTFVLFYPVLVESTISDPRLLLIILTGIVGLTPFIRSRKNIIN